MSSQAFIRTFSKSLLAAVLCANFAAAGQLPEAWSTSAFHPGITRIGLNGSALGTYHAGFATESAAVVGDDVWLTLHSQTTIRRSSFAGELLGEIQTPDFNGHIEAVGDEVWTASSENIHRFTNQGSPIGAIPFSGASAIERVGDEVWIASGFSVTRFNLNADPIGSFATPSAVSTMKRAGNEVVMGISTDIGRYSLAGQFLGTFNSDCICGGNYLIEQVGDEIWSDNTTGMIKRFTMDYQYIGSHNLWTDGTAMIVIPEPAAIALLFPLLIRRTCRA